LQQAKDMPQAAQQQLFKSVNEYSRRAQNTAQAANVDLENNLRSRRNESAPAPHVREGLICPLWIGDTLLLGRRVTINEQEYIQGCWLNWPAIRSTLLESIRDLLPLAQLAPAVVDSQDRQPRRLAALPVKLIPGAIAPEQLAPDSPVRMTLLVSWVCTILGLTAVAALLWGAIALSQRRAAFVSAVTHELRTPLTTVSMYAEMLEEEMVPDEAKRKRYLSTLRAEADRLGHLVENVLAYSRIERGNPSTRLQEIALGELIDGVRARLVGRAEQAGMQLCIEGQDGAGGLRVRADASAVEQILFNLVDNAGKYGRNDADRRLHLQIGREGRYAILRLQDHGHGIAVADAKRLFRPFSKSARDAANSAPGVGLGLALSRRLARAMKGDLMLCPSPAPGACFVLKLEVSER
jgi:signal transduction histidine kinase